MSNYRPELIAVANPTIRYNQANNSFEDLLMVARLIYSLDISDS
jgi:hypothetical protein